MRFLLFLAFGFACSASAELSVHSIFSDHMVLQRGKPIVVWGSATAGEHVDVDFADQSLHAEVGDDGSWAVTLEPMPKNAEPQDLVVSSGDDEIRITDVLVGEVWILGGQSNMEHEIHSVYDGDLELASANYPEIRLMTIPRANGGDPVTNFEALNEFNSWNNSNELKGNWAPCTPEALKKFTAIGYIFGRRIHLVDDVPVGLIDASRGGTNVETWTSRESLEAIPDALPLLETWDEKIAAYDPAADLAGQLKNWERDTENRKKKGEVPRPKPTEPRPGPAFDQNRPSSCYNGMISAFAGFTVRGAVFNQGYNNALGDSRPALYAKTIQAMIRDWRTAFRDEQLPFCIIGMTAGGKPQTIETLEVGMIDATPYIREAQLRAANEMDGVEFLPAWDQQMAWYHPFKKVALGERSARWALVTTMGHNFPWKPALLAETEIGEGEITLTFDQTVQSHDGRSFEGFAIAGEDQHFFPAQAEWFVKGKDKNNRDQHDRSKVVISSPHVPNPVAVRYAWARNPLANVTQDEHHLRNVPVPSFRTDDWPYPEAPFDQDGLGQHRGRINELRKQAEAWAKDRQLLDARRVIAEQEPAE
ncbi:MAG: sialate O-acetylesterase [Verrucomicrobiales bacterium]|jgi:sialate O-acetylesterase